MNFKACTFERLVLIFGFGRGAQVVKTSPFLEVNLYGASVDVGCIIFYLVRFRPWGPTKTLDFGRRRSIFLTMQSQDSDTITFQSGVVSQQRLRPRRFDSTVKRVPKLRFEPVSFLFLACF